MSANLQAMNSSKTKVMIISKNKNLKENFQCEIGGKMIKHSPTMKVLGMTLNENLN